MTKDDFIQFHKIVTDETEIKEVTEAIKSGWLTSGPKTKKFEEEFKNYIGTQHAVVVSSWTAAAHLSLEALGVTKNDEIILPAVTFTATAEIVCYFHATPIIVDIDPQTINISIDEIEKHISPKTKVIIPVHYGGLPCDMDEIMEIASSKGIKVLEDAAHSLPALYKNRKIGTIGDVTCFSFYATKTLSTGEGGMICSNDPELAKRCSIMRLHGISADVWNRYTENGSWYYEVIAPGYKYNFTDIQAGLGLAQLKKLESNYQKRVVIAEKYNNAFKCNELIQVPCIKPDRKSAWHLYSILLNIEALNITRADFVNKIKEKGIGCSVHFIPLYRHPFYRDNFKLLPENYPNSEYVYQRQVSLPIWPGMNDEQINRVIDAVLDLINKYKR
jgi:perosamine synthetase